MCIKCIDHIDEKPKSQRFSLFACDTIYPCHSFEKKIFALTRFDIFRLLFTRGFDPNIAFSMHFPLHPNNLMKSSHREMGCVKLF